MAVDWLCWNPPGIVIVSEWRCPVVKVLMRVVKLGQRTGRWMVNT